MEYAKQNVRINAVAPAAIETRMYEEVAATSEMKQMFAAAHPVGRIGQPDEVANAVVYLCSDGLPSLRGTRSELMAATPRNETELLGDIRNFGGNYKFHNGIAMYSQYIAH